MLKPATEAMTGLGAARTEAIAAQTGVTKAMIYYYFQSKEELYQAVLERCLVGMLGMAEHLQLDCLPPDLCAANVYAIHGQGPSRRYLAWHPVPGPAPDFHRLDRFPPLPPASRR